MTSLIISPLRLRKIKLAVMSTVSFIFIVVALTLMFNINPIMFKFDLITYERYQYFLNFPIDLLAKPLVYLYQFLLSDWVLNGAIWGGLIGYIVSVVMIKKLVIDKETTKIRGNSIITPKELKSLVKEKSRLTIGKEKIKIPFTNENRSFGIIGMAGAGKTQAVFNMLNQVVNFKETMIIYDRKPDFWIGYYREDQDYLFYPSDTRSIRWNFFLDIPDDEQDMLDEVDKISKSFIPDTDSKEKFWDNTARMILKAVIIKIKTSPNPSPKKLIDFIRSFQTREEIWENIQDVNDKYGLRIKALLTEAAQATAGSIMMNLEPYFAKIMRPEFYYDEGDFSITDFINSTQNENIDQRLFLVQTKKEEGNYEGYFRVMLDMMTRAVLSLENNSTRRIWTFLDEFQTLGKLSEINDLLAEGRSKGSSVTIATQDLSRVEDIYGENLMRNIFQLLSTKLMLQYDDPKGQKFLSEFLGEQEVEEKNKNRMISRDASKDIEQVSERNTTKKILLVGELGLLKQLSAYLKMPGFPTCIIHFKYFELSIVHEHQRVSSTTMFEHVVENKESKVKNTTKEKDTEQKPKVRKVRKKVVEDDRTKDIPDIKKEDEEEFEKIEKFEIEKKEEIEINNNMLSQRILA